MTIRGAAWCYRAWCYAPLAHGRVEFHASLHQRVQHGEAAAEALLHQFFVPGALGALLLMWLLNRGNANHSV